MNFTRVNIITYKAVCIICCITTTALGLKILYNGLFVKGALSMVAAAIFSLLMFQRPYFRAWLQVATVIVITALIISELARI